MQLTPAEQDAVVRWQPGQTGGHVESHFIKLNLGPGRALWLKLTLLQRTIGRRQTVAEGWAIGFGLGPAGSHLARKVTWPASEATIEQDCFFAKVGSVVWRHGHTAGELVDEGGGPTVAWDLTYRTDHEGFRHFPRAWMYRGGLPKSKATSPQIDTRFDGTVTLGGNVVEVADAPGMLGHNWGRQQAEAWTWVHANVWKGEGAEGLVFEAVTGRVRFGPVRAPQLTISHVRWPGERVTLNTWGRMLRTEVETDGLAYALRGEQGDRRIEARFQAPAERFVGVTYHDPDGRIANCLNTKIADATLKVWGRREDRSWRVLVDAASDASGALEIGDREGTRGVRTYIR